MARREAEERAEKEAEEKAKRKAEKKAKREAEEKDKREAESKNWIEVAEKAQREAEEEAKREETSSNLAKANAKLRKIREIENENRRKAEKKAEEETEEMARIMADFLYNYKSLKLDLARKEAEINAKFEALERVFRVEEMPGGRRFLERAKEFHCELCKKSWRKWKCLADHIYKYHSDIQGELNEEGGYVKFEAVIEPESGDIDVKKVIY